ncbi:MAG: MATE family efflux transporter [Opitutales bacterium]
MSKGEKIEDGEVRLADPVRHDVPAGQLVGKLGGKSLLGQVMALALWPFLQNLMGVGVGFADMVIAGRIPVEDAKAIFDMMGASMYLVWLLMILQGAMGTGAMALVSRSTGARDMKSANLALGQSLLLGVVSGLVSAAMLWLLTPPLGGFFNLSASARVYLQDYMNMAAIMAPFSGVLFVASSALRAYGDTRTPFWAMLFVNLVNFGLSLVFVFSFDMGVTGLALGTVMGWAGGAVLILWFLRPGSRLRREAGDAIPLELRLGNLRYDAPMLRRIWTVSWPSIFEIMGMWSVHAVGLYFIGKLQQGATGAHAMVIRLESMSFMPGFALGMAASTLAGQYLGAKNPEMAKKAVRFCWLIAVIAMGTTGLLVAIFNREFLSLFGNVDPEQLQMAGPVIQVVGCMQILNATMMVMKMSMRGVGDTRTVTLYSFCSMGLIRVGALWLLMTYFESVSLMMIWFVMMTDVACQAAIFLRLHFKGHWLDKRV